MIEKLLISKRFRGYLPVVVDIETGGFNANTDALLEMAFVFLNMDENGKLSRGRTVSCHVLPFHGAHMDPKCLEVNRIDPFHPFRFAVDEGEALKQMFGAVKQELKKQKCQRAILVGHNPSFDLGFMQAAVRRCHYKNNPFHSFTTFDTATLGALAYGETILVKAVLAAGLGFDRNEAHSAIYDAEKTAELFCKIVNRWKDRN